MESTMPKIFFSLIIMILMVCPVFAGSPAPGDQAPEFSLKSMDGKEVALSKFKGKVVLIGMFHICVPCMNQAMEFNKARKQLDEDKVVILGINTNGDSREAVAKYLSKFPEKVNFPYLIDPVKQVYKSYSQREMPTVLIIDQESNLKARTPGVSADQLVAYIKKMI
jgi:cytochrome c biogenesis protein CcmG, thiol:disulfide interchange protein DsbE